MSNCQIIGPCCQILVVCVFSQYAFTFTSCLLPPLRWNNLIWSEPSFLPKKWGGNLSWKHHFCWWERWKVFGDVCWLSLKGSVEWFVALEVLLGCLWVGMGNLCLLKACRKCSKHWVNRAKKKQEQEVGLLSRKEEIHGLSLFILWMKVFYLASRLYTAQLLSLLVLRTRICKWINPISMGTETPLEGNGSHRWDGCSEWLTASSSLPSGSCGSTC